jgi:hypothetical protein
VTGSIRRQYLVSGVPGGAIVAAGSGCDAAIGDANEIMPKATINPLCAMSFLLDGNAGNPAVEY